MSDGNTDGSWQDGLIHYLRTHHNETDVIDWYSDDMDVDGWDYAFVQTWFTDRAAWTIGPPWAADDPVYDITWEPDLLVFAHMAADPTCHCGECHAPFEMFTAPVSRDADPQKWDLAMTLISGAATVAPVDSFWIGAPGWTDRCISRAIEDWCLQVVGRFCQARWAPELGPSPAAKAAIELGERIMAMAAGIEPTYQINDPDAPVRMMVDETTMEMLLQQFVEDD